MKHEVIINGLKKMHAALNICPFGIIHQSQKPTKKTYDSLLE
jgi:hypothetical protein